MFPRNAAPLTRMLSYQPLHIRTLQRGMRKILTYSGRKRCWSRCRAVVIVDHHLCPSRR